MKVVPVLLALGLAACASQKQSAAPEAPASSDQAAAAGPPAAGPERTGVVTMQGNPLTLIGPALAIGSTLPDFVLTANDMSDLSGAGYKDKVLVLSVLPSLDTGVCALQTRTFNQKASQLSEDVVVLTVSMDLPFAQKRFCGAEGIDRVITASDYKHRSFGPSFGVLIKELGLLSRAVFVVDRGGTIRHVEYVSEISQEPSYDAALQAVEAAL
jgi:thiol peroxidase